jgi:hypothetical protein
LRNPSAISNSFLSSFNYLAVSIKSLFLFLKAIFFLVASAVDNKTGLFLKILMRSIGRDERPIPPNIEKIQYPKKAMMLMRYMGNDTVMATLLI